MGHVWTSTYDTDGRLPTATDPLGTVTKYEYDQYGNRTKEIIAAGTPDESVTTYAYNEYGDLKTVTKGDAITTYEYNSAGQVSKITDALGNSTTMTYDDAGNLLIRTLPLIGDTVYEDYDFKGNPGTITDVNGNTVTNTYDSLGRVKTATNMADNSTTQYAYLTTCSTGTCGGASGQGKLDYVILPEGNKIDYDYDSAGNLIVIADSEGNAQKYSYDLKGNKIKAEIRDVTGELQRGIAYQYDILGRLTKKIYHETGSIQYTYDPLGNRTSIKNANSRTDYIYDKVGRLERVDQQDGTQITYSYNGRYGVSSVRDGEGSRRTPPPGR